METDSIIFNGIFENKRLKILILEKIFQLFNYFLGVYKPSHTIEFNREGEVLLYSCEPT